MAALPLDLVVFDLDGTLADTIPDVAPPLNHALAGFGRPPIPLAEVRDLVGHGSRDLVRRGLERGGPVTEAMIDEALERFTAYYLDNICVHTTVFEGVEQAFDTLQAEGIRLALCTNKLEAPTRSLLDALGWSGRFAAIVGGDTLPRRKPHPEHLLETIRQAGGGHAVMVGDSIVDVATAKAAGIPVVAVSFGYADRPAAELGADFVIDHYSQLAETLTKLH